MFAEANSARIDHFEAKIWSAISRKEEDVFPPEDKLVLHARRDVKAFPFLEDIATWAENSYGFKFGNLRPAMQMNQQEYDMLTTVEEIPMLFQKLEKAGRENVLADMKSVGYSLTSIEVLTRVSDVLLSVQETDLDKKIPHFKLSQGMFRTLAVIIYLEYLISRKRPATVVIDDFGEGLDFARSTKLAELVFQKCEKHGVQLVVTSNDSFLMDVVDLKYWNVLRRKGKVVSGLNWKNNQALFEDFRFTGLSNFDFFSSNFVAQKSLEPA